MLLPAVVVGIRALGPIRPAAVLALGLSLGVAAGLASPQLDLESRVADLGDQGGTAAGRLYHWRVNWQVLQEAGPLGVRR